MSGGFNPKVVAALILVGVFTFAGFFVLGAYAPSLRDGNDGGAHGLSRGAVGYAALADLLEREGRAVVLSRSTVGTERNALWVVTPRRPYATIDPLPGAGLPTLLVLPKWQTRDDEKVRGWVDLVGTAAPRAITLEVQGHEMEIALNGYEPPAEDETPGAGPAPTDGPIGAPGEEMAEEVTEGIEEEAEGAPSEADDAEETGEQTIDLAELFLAGGTPFADLTPTPVTLERTPQAHAIGQDPPSGPLTIRGLQTMAGYHLTPVWTDAEGRMVLGRVAFPEDHVDPSSWFADGPWTSAGTDAEGRQLTRTYVLSDPDLLNTMGLATPEGAAAATALISALAGDRAVFFDLAGAGFGRTENLLTLALEPPFSAATLTVLLAGALLAWAATARFGPPKADPVGLGLGKAALADQAATLLEASGRDVTLGPRYAALTRRRIARLLGNEAMPDAALARTAKRAGLADLGPASAAAHDASDAPSLLRAARRLHALTTHLTDRKPS